MNRQDIQKEADLRFGEVGDLDRSFALIAMRIGFIDGAEWAAGLQTPERLREMAERFKQYADESSDKGKTIAEEFEE